MIRQKDTGKVDYIEGGHELLSQLSGFDALTATMVLQFVNDEEIEAVIKAMSQSIKPGGVIVATVYNLEFAELCLKSKQFFSRSGDQFKTDYGNGILIETFIRHEETYRKIFEKYGLKLRTSLNPPFTEEFVKNISGHFPSAVSEYLVMVYHKR